MPRPRRTPLLLVLCLLLAGVPALAPPAAARGPEWGEQAARAYAEGSMAFALDLLRRVGGGPGNVVFSPFSLSTALGMAHAGARGETARQLQAALHLPGDPEAIRAFLPRVLPVPPTEGPSPRGRGDEGPNYALTLASGVFPQAGWAFEPSFQRVVAQDYGAEFSPLDYRQPRAARAAINAWVEKHTKGRIQDIVPEGLPTPDTRITLANAVHFRASWQTPFREASTVPLPFTVRPGEEIQTPTMRQTSRYRWGETKTATLVELPYRGGETSLVIVLPRAKDGLDALVAGLDAAPFLETLHAMTPRKVGLSLPKFTFTAQFDLVPVLTRMGLEDAFSTSKADFTGITRQEPVCIGAVLHKAFIALDEQGTEAAAATVLALRAGEAARPEEPVPFVVDHPFLFVLRHVETGAPLFVGRVDRPGGP